MTRQYFAEIAPRVLDAGWPAVLPMRGKRAFLPGWQRFNQQPVTDDQLDQWVHTFPRLNVGLPAGHGVVGIDIDVLDERLARRVADLADDVLGTTPLLRIGRHPKSLRIYRGDVQSRKANPIEIFGNSGVCVAFGRHPDTGMDYVWPYDSPLDLGPEELPEVTQTQVDVFVARVRRLLPHRGNRGGCFDTEELREQRRGKYGGAWLATVEGQLRAAEPGELHQVMTSTAAALAARGFPAWRIRSIFERNFPAPRSGRYGRCWRGGLDDAIESAIRKFGVPR